ncbi:MAG: hypothetical protein IKT40_14395 [Bacilli bacterium]|nr:hypothetical protein [Bacilli bacterium]
MNNTKQELIELIENDIKSLGTTKEDIILSNFRALINRYNKDLIDLETAIETYDNKLKCLLDCLDELEEYETIIVYKTFVRRFGERM